MISSVGLRLASGSRAGDGVYSWATNRIESVRAQSRRFATHLFERHLRIEGPGEEALFQRPLFGV